ncbi:glutamine synthetase family protein [Streptomyces sp. NPDC004539]|uniref:glutamine synthetase family protein n=1 Tax=Streptomyces sp. NPDC004539 TaxID=3154280 RepID=UPI0033BEFB83
MSQHPPHATAEQLSALAADLTAHGVDLVRVLWSDLHGVARGKELAAAELPRFAGHGVAFCQAAMVTDLGGNPLRGPESDGSGWPDADARIDPGTLFRPGWLPGTAFLLAEVTDPAAGGTPLRFDPRSLLRRQIDRALALGLHPVVAPELEFYLLREDPAAAHGWRAYLDRDTSGYVVGTLYDPDDMLPLLIRECRALGLGVHGGIQEFSGGQFEINHSHGPALDAADRAFLFKYAVKELAARHRMRATFMGKPFADRAGSGSHTHLSLTDASGTNLFASDDDGTGDGLTPLTRSFVAGLLDHAPALMAVLNPNVNAYKRLAAEGSLAPTHATWGYDNRLAYARIPPERGPGARVEVRIGDAASNPYLALAALLAAGLDGVERDLAPPPPISGDRGDAGPGLPASLGAALEALERDKVLADALGERFTEVYCALKRQELARFERAVTDWEFHEYSWML